MRRPFCSLTLHPSIRSADCLHSTVKISLCMIVRDEERFLRECLESARAVVDEMVIVDTGSQDATVAIAREFGARVLQHVWDDDFAAARNCAVTAASEDWMLALDADERLEPA